MMSVIPPRHDDLMFLMTRCAGCDAPGMPVCTTCRFALVGRSPRPQTHGVRAAVPFTGRARDVVLGLKYRNRRQVGRHLAGLVTNQIVQHGDHTRVDVVTWAPTSASRRRERGFDQGELLARHIAAQLGLPARRLLDREPATGHQTGRTRRERLAGSVFRARPDVRGQRILVVDDVVTTGATMTHAAQALESAGALG
jgi:competence protein ComFC